MLIIYMSKKFGFVLKEERRYFFIFQHVMNGCLYVLLLELIEDTPKWQCYYFISNYHNSFGRINILFSVEGSELPVFAAWSRFKGITLHIPSNKKNCCPLHDSTGVLEYKEKGFLFR